MQQQISRVTANDYHPSRLPRRTADTPAKRRVLTEVMKVYRKEMQRAIAQRRPVPPIDIFTGWML